MTMRRYDFPPIASTSSILFSVTVAYSNCARYVTATWLKNNPNAYEELFCAYVYPASYPEGTRHTRIRPEVIFATTSCMPVPQAHWAYL